MKRLPRFRHTSNTDDVPDFYLARLYGYELPSNHHHHHHHQEQQQSQSHPQSPSQSMRRPRGGDGRFVARSDIITPCETPSDIKSCGWCGTTSTSQWRVGPMNCSIRMSILCNACGINYRRALTKTTDGCLNLDALAQQIGGTRLSIQKALKRQMKRNQNNNTNNNIINVKRSRQHHQSAAHERVSVASLVESNSNNNNSVYCDKNINLDNDLGDYDRRNQKSFSSSRSNYLPNSTPLLLASSSSSTTTNTNSTGAATTSSSPISIPTNDLFHSHPAPPLSSYDDVDHHQYHYQHHYNPTHTHPRIHNPHHDCTTSPLSTLTNSDNHHSIAHNKSNGCSVLPPFQSFLGQLDQCKVLP